MLDLNKWINLRGSHDRPIKSNQYFKYDDYLIVFLNMNQITLVDLEYEQFLPKLTLYATKRGYVKTTINRKKYYFHRIVTNAESDYHVDHIDGNTLDNRKKNLRAVPPIINHQNRHKAWSSTGFLNISEHSDGGYYARISRGGKTYCTPVRKDIEICKKDLRLLKKELKREGVNV